MPLAVGERLGPYEIVAQIGAGGMGVVYRARDSRVGRDVAIKVAAEHFGDRFEREARAVAALNHTNICTLYDVGPNYLVMELIEGEPLKGPLPLSTALDYATQIAHALDAAHERGIVHRDLKPANIRVRSDGTVKVLDFGLAKIDAMPATESDPAHSPTISAVGTQAGTILGTAAYMAPEQARGKPVDKRADVWAFGAVFYEMLTGRRAFDGDDTSSILAAVLRAEPNLADVPTSIRGVIAACLEKDPRKRLRDIGDVWRLLDDTPRDGAPPSKSGRAGWIAAAALAALSAVALWAPWRMPPPAAAAPFVRLDVDLGSEISLLRLAAPTFSSVAISPDGTRLVFVGGISGGPPSLLERRLDEDVSREIPGTQGAGNPFFSPDGQWVAFWRRGTLSKVPLGGGAVVPLADLTTMAGGRWADDGSLIVATGRPLPSGLVRIPSGGGTPIPLIKLEEHEWFHNYPDLLPTGRAVLAGVVNTPPSAESTNIEVIPLDGSPRKIILRGATSPRYLHSGHLIYANRNAVFAVAFDIDALEIRGTAVPVMPDALLDPVTTGAQFDATRAGTLVYRKKQEGGQSAPRLLHWIDSTGKQEALLPKPNVYIGRPRVSPDGGRVTFLTADGSGLDAWLYEPERDAMTRLHRSNDSGFFFNPIWSHDGQSIIFGTMGAGVYVSRVNNTAQSQELIAGGTFMQPTSVSRDGKRLVFSQIDGRPQIWSAELTSAGGGLKAGTPSQLFASQFEDGEGVISPDGGWLAYQSNASGQFEVYVQRLPNSGSSGERVQVSNNGGFQPVWSPNGRDLLYLSALQVVAVDYTMRDGSFAAGKPRPWATNLTGVTAFDIAPDGKRVLAFVRTASGVPPADHTVVLLQNFHDELRRRAPAAR